MRPAPLNLVGHVVPIHNGDGHEMVHESGRQITSLVLRLAEQQEVEQQQEKKQAKEREVDLGLLEVMCQHPDVTSIDDMRVYAKLARNECVDAVGRILRADWARRGKRGKPYEITALGLAQLSALTQNSM
jgi:hypothetical protein